MKITEILKENKNIDVLMDLVSKIKQNLTKKIPKEQIITIDIKSDIIEELKQKYSENKKILTGLDYIKDLRIIFDNKNKNAMQNAFYRDKDKTIVLNIAKIKSNTDLINLKKNNNTTKKIWQTLFHELRHSFQFSEYGEYIKSLKDNDWSQRPTEWDALWSDLLYKHNPDYYNNVQDYAETITKELNDIIKAKYPYKKLPKDIIKKYMKKSAVYYHKEN
ncbi:MAG: hypothetical protein ACOCRK_05120 [bacterium]